ncbi:MAG TPA: L,D-transpeptidase family protein, partial [bacterium]|nr:L,D-transpeptidase family protein [bacterium]
DGRLRRRRAEKDARVSQRLADALAWGSIGDTLASMPPPSGQYRQLRSVLADYRAIATRGGWGRLGKGTLRAGDSGPRVESLRARLAATGDLPEAGEGAFDDVVAAGVRAFQERHGLPEDGVVGKDTLDALDVPVESRIRALQVNLERLRWLPRDLGNPAVLVNAPAFELVVLENEQVMFRSKVVVGRRKDWETPVLDARIESVVVDPSWDIPASIAREEVLPLMARHPGWAAREKIRVLDRQGAEVPPESIDALAFEGARPLYRLSQDPGPTNPLGSLKIVFPNPESVYLHDTPSRSLFARPDRAASHGCVRVEKARELAALLLAGSGWDEEMLAAAESEGITRTLALPHPVDVHLVYLTAFVAAGGRANFRRDLYRRDDEVANAIGASARQA